MRKGAGDSLRSIVRVRGLLMKNLCGGGRGGGEKCVRRGIAALLAFSRVSAEIELSFVVDGPRNAKSEKVTGCGRVTRRAGRRAACGSHESIASLELTRWSWGMNHVNDVVWNTFMYGSESTNFRRNCR